MIIRPIENDLEKYNINNLTFVMDEGLRSLPLAVLHNGNRDYKKGFIINKYSVGLMPSMTLTDTDYRNISNTKPLATGTSEFSSPDINPLPAVKLELDFIQNLYKVEPLRERNFTVDKLKNKIEREEFSILHIASHAQFEKTKENTLNSSFIQYWNRGLKLTEIPDLKLEQKKVDLLVLSACQTAIGNKEAELGFAGLAYYAGVKSVLASLWEVDDTATFGLMTQFYQNLKSGIIKAEALRLAQLAMLEGKVRTRLSDGKLFAPGLPENEIKIPSEDKTDFSDPRYWSGYTIVGNPW